SSSSSSSSIRCAGDGAIAPQQPVSLAVVPDIARKHRKSCSPFSSPSTCDSPRRSSRLSLEQIARSSALQPPMVSAAAAANAATTVEPVTTRKEQQQPVSGVTSPRKNNTSLSFSSSSSRGSSNRGSSNGRSGSGSGSSRLAERERASSNGPTAAAATKTPEKTALKSLPRVAPSSGRVSCPRQQHGGGDDDGDALNHMHDC
ncbi:unnamed protein product, partial [Pylaiella littoralis]